MKPLKIRHWKQRDYWVIDGRRVGLTDKHGKFDTQAEARAAADELLAKHTLGLVVRREKLELVEPAIEAYQNYIQQRHTDGEISADHAADFTRSMRELAAIKIDAKLLSKHELAIIAKPENRADVSAAIMRSLKASCNSRSTLSKRVKAAKGFFTFCVQRGWIDVSPMQDVRITMEKTIDNRAPRIQPEAVQQLVSAGLSGETLLSRAMVLTSLSTGMRQGEMRALAWKDVDFDGGYVRVSQAIKHMTSEAGAPKTKRGYREIPVDADLIQLLRELKMCSRFSKPDDYVFATDSGKPKQKKTLQALIKRVAEAAGLPAMKWGDMRHFFASVQLSALGEDWAEVAALMGHHSPSFTYAQYGHYSKNEAKQDKARSAAAAAIFGK